MFHPHDLNELMLFKPFMNQMWCLVLSRKCRLKRCGGLCLHTVLINWDFLERWLIIHFFGRQFVQQWIVANFFTVTIEIYCYQTLLVSQKNQFPATFSSTFHSKESLLPLPWGNPPFASLNQGWGDALILSECTRGFLERMHTLVLYTKALYLAQSRENVKLKVNSSGVRQPHMSGPFSLESHSPLNNGHILAKACTGPKRVYCPIVYSMKSRGKPHRTIMMRYGIMKAPESEEQRGTVGDHTTSSQVCVAVL